MKGYVVTKEGVYRHEIIGLFSEYPEAKEAGKKAIEAEGDDYHTFSVLEVDENGEGALGYWKRVDKRFYQHDEKRWYEVGIQYIAVDDQP